MQILIFLFDLLPLDFIITSQTRYLRYCYFYKKANKNLLSYQQYNFDWTVDDVDNWETFPVFLLYNPTDNPFLNCTRLKANIWLFLKILFVSFIFVLSAPFFLVMIIGIYKAVF
jgi:hypothetical protein